MPRHSNEEVFLKVRVRATRRLRVGQIVRRVKQAVRTRIVPEGIELMVMDWEKGTGHRLRAGSYVGDAMIDALSDMYQLVKASSVRVRKAE